MEKPGEEKQGRGSGIVEEPIEVCDYESLVASSCLST